MGSNQSNLFCSDAHCATEVCEARSRQKDFCKDLATIKSQRRFQDEDIQSTAEAIIQATIEYEDEANDRIRFQLQPGGTLVMFVNGRRNNGGKESSGAISSLFWGPKPGYGGVIRTQHHFGGAIPELQLEELRAMAIAAGVQHNIPWDLDDVDAPDPLPPGEGFKLSGRVAVGPSAPLFIDTLGRLMPGEKESTG